MGFFDRLTSKKPAPPAGEAPAAEPQAVAGVVARLTTAREKLDAKDLPAAMAIYDELLAAAGERADVLVAISGDLGAHGHVVEIIEHIAPRYDAERHGAATGLNILQAYLVMRNADAAQHVLDILFALNRPDLEERLHGFSNAIAELIQERHVPLDPGAVGVIAETPKVGLITISKPIWFYGLEPMAAQLLPPKEGRLRRLAFAQLALPGAYADLGEAMRQPEDELGRLSRALPLWFAEAFYFSAAYAPLAAVGVMSRPGGPSHPVLFGVEWTTDNLQQLVNTSDGAIDYILTGALRATGGQFEVLLRVWEVKKLRERKTFTARWTPATADVELTKLHEQIRTFMEWKPAGAGLAYAPPAQPRAWLDTLGAALGLFLVEKKILPSEALASPVESLAQAARQAATGEAASLAFLTLRARAKTLGLAPGLAEAALAPSPRVEQAASLLA